jgi:Ca-activated chloride channel family protein
MREHSHEFVRSHRPQWLGVVAGVALAALPGIAPAAMAPGSALGTSVEIDRPYVLRGAIDPIYVFLRFDAPEDAVEEANRPPLNLSLVLDRSGSMADGGKMEFLKPAARMAADRLTGKDALSVVEYDDAITLMWPAQPVSDMTRLKMLIDELSPRGSTNLAGGLVRGIDEVGAYRGGDTGMMNRVLLLSDGLANVGITNPKEIGEIVRKARERGIRVSAMGLGRDYDEDLMQNIAEMGGGNYYYVEHPTQLTRIFEQELMTAFRVSAKDIKVEFQGGAAVRSAEIIGYADAGTGQNLSLNWGDFYAGEERGLVVRIEADTNQLGSLQLGTLKVSFTDVANNRPEQLTEEVRVEVTEDSTIAAQNINNKVRVEAALVESERVQERAVKLYEEGKQEEANKEMAALSTSLSTQNETLKDERIKNKIEALNVEQNQMAAAAARPDMQEDFVKASKQRLSQAKQGKRSLYMLKEGDKGLEVERLQQALKDAGHYQGPIDGIYTAEVRKAVESYQTAQNIAVDGVAGPATMDRLGAY